MTDSEREYQLDDDAQLVGSVLVGGSPLKLFRLTDAGRRIVERVAAHEPVGTSGLTESLLDAGAVHPVPGPGTDRQFGPADVSVVVPSLGPPADAPPGALVVDDGTDPPIPGAAIRLDVNSGPAAARNAGWRSVDTPLVAFVDSDVDVAPDWLDGLVGHFDDERVALVAPRVATRASDSRIAAHDAAHGPLDLGPTPARIRAGTRVSYVPAAALVVRVEALRELEGFDEQLRAGEDVDLVWRLDRAGWRCRYEPSVVVHHAPRRSWSAWCRQRITYGASAAPLAKRHPGALAPVRMSGWSFLAWAAAAGVNPLVGAAINGATAAALVRKLPDLPRELSFSIAWRGNLHAGRQLALAVRRVWWPVLAVAALRSRAARRVLLWSLLAAGNPIVVADDAAYSVGVWRGMLRERAIDPAVPAITRWP